jgi:putative Mn2+ efflux pump MntP
MRKALMRLTIIGAIPFVIMGAGMLLGQSTGVNFLSSLAWFLRIVTVILGIFLLLRYFYRAVIKNPQLKENHKNILLGIYAFTISILTIELGLTFYSQSTLNPASYSSINWFMFNWKPINS